MSGNPNPASQSRWMSFVEAVTNVAVGYIIAVLTQITVFPLFGFRVPMSTNLLIGAIFTIVSLARSYVLRRVFEAMRARAPQRNTAAR